MKEWNPLSVKKIIVLNGSPKRQASSTMRVTNAFVEGMLNNCSAEVETINIADLNIKPCIGCLSCWGRTEGTCILKDDDIVMVKEKITSADIVIESYPLYFFGMPGIMKVFTDRMLGMMCTYEGQMVPENGESFHGIRSPKDNQKLVVISSCAYTEVDRVYDSLRNQYDCICGKNSYTALFCPQLKTLIDLNNDAKISRYLAPFQEAGKEFVLNGFLTNETIEHLKKPPFSAGAYKVFLNAFWTQERNTHED